MFEKYDMAGYVHASEGVERKTLVYGEHTLMTEFRMKAPRLLAAHSRPHEQVGYLVSGKLRMSIGSEIDDVEPGDSWCILGDVVHQVEVVEDAVVIEVFSPVREEYLPR